MLGKKEYANGQIVYDLKEEILTYYYKNGNLKAHGPYINELMEGEWKFFRESGQLWQVANFKGNKKHGSWLRYDKFNKVEFDEIFRENKLLKK